MKTREALSCKQIEALRFRMRLFDREVEEGEEIDKTLERVQEFTAFLDHIQITLMLYKANCLRKKGESK